MTRLLNLWAIIVGERELNLQDREAEQILKRRTSKLIGGYVTEHLFSSTFYNKRGSRITKDWWGSIENNDSGKLHFFVVKNQLEEVDVLFADKLNSAGLDWGQIIVTDDGQWKICANGREISFEQYVYKHNLKSIDDNIDSRRTQSDPMMDECIEYYRKHGLLHHIAQSIQLEDAFLNRYFWTINFDCIYAGPYDRLYMFEIKFKNEFSKEDRNGVRRLVFGMDTFPYDNFFKILIEAGIAVYNVVLYNDLKKNSNRTTTNIFEYLENKPAEERLWKYKRLPDSLDGYPVHHTEQSYTSFRGKNGRDQYCIPLKEYRPFERDAKINSWGKCPECGGDMVLVEYRKGNYEFKGCKNYKNHPQQRTRSDF